jgi:large subunit ribosomal protein L15
VSLQDILTTDTNRKQRTRVGRGIGSGLGKTGGRGSKGEGSRTGGKNRGPLFEGGQMPFWMRLPKRGFSNFATKVVYVPVKLDVALARVASSELTNDAIVAAGLIPKGSLAKLTGGKDVKAGRKITASVRVTASARAAIEAAGGKVTE